MDQNKNNWEKRGLIFLNNKKNISGTFVFKRKKERKNKEEKKQLQSKKNHFAMKEKERYREREFVCVYV